MDARQRLARVHAQALGYPDAYEEEPWGHPAIKVRKKAFLFCSRLDTPEPSMSVKLPLSAAEARQREGVGPMGCGLGKSGWCAIDLSADLSLDLLLDWLDESYRAVAPKTLVRGLGATRPTPANPSAPAPEPPTEVPHVLLVGDGPRRLDRATRALSQHGIASASVPLQEALDAAGGLQPEIGIIDMGRSAARARDVAEALVLANPDTRWLLAGAATKVARALATRLEVATFAEPPGDPRVIGAVAT